MLKIDMVRCYIKSPFPQRDNPEGLGSQVRYIPKEIFRLWKFLMTNVKKFEISHEEHSFWVDDEGYAKEKASFQKHKAEKVIQIHFRYYKNVEGGRPVIRYFPYAYFNQIMQFFMRNFSDDHIQNDAEKITGYFVILQ